MTKSLLWILKKWKLITHALGHFSLDTRPEKYIHVWGLILSHSWLHPTPLAQMFYYISPNGLRQSTMGQALD
jgi:hypothetical protein